MTYKPLAGGSVSTRFYWSCRSAGILCRLLSVWLFALYCGAEKVSSPCAEIPILDVTAVLMLGTGYAA